MVALAVPVRSAPQDPGESAPSSPRAMQALIQEALRTPMACVHDAYFDDPGAEEQLFPQCAVNLMELDGARRPASRFVQLDPMQERQAFLRYNYARRRAAAAIAEYRASGSDFEGREVVRWYRRVRSTRDAIVHANLPLVRAMIRRHGTERLDVDELISEGNLALLRAIDAFDVSRGYKFSSYACKAILKALRRTARRTQLRRRRFAIHCERQWPRANAHESGCEMFQQCLRDNIAGIIRAKCCGLSALELSILNARFAVNGGPDAQAMTLKEIGRIVGLTRERVRQLQNRALAKLRAAMEDNP